MLRPAVRTVLADAAGRAPSADAWALLLVAAGVDEAKAATLPARLGYVFHLGAYGERDVVAQLDAWGAALRVRAEPEVAQVVERAAARLREEVEREPLPPPVAAALPASSTPQPPSAPPVPRAPSAPSAPRAPLHVPAAATVQPAPRQRPRPQQQRPHPQQQQQGRPGQPPGWPAPPPPGARPARGAARAQAPRPNRRLVVVGVVGTLVLLSCCLFGLVTDLLGGTS